MRELIHYGIIHSYSEVGRPKEKAYLPREGLYQQLWDGINKELDKMYFRNFSKVRVYQDSIPKDSFFYTYGDNWRIVNDLKDKSQNMETLAKLLERGAIVEGTESDLLLSLHGVFAHKWNSIAIFCQKHPSLPKTWIKKVLDGIDLLIIQERDKQVAKTIRSTLEEGELGILFMGLDHEVYKYLPKDISISRRGLMYELQEE